MSVQDLGVRTKEFSLRIVKLFSALPKSPEAQIIGKQMLRSGTSVGAHYREGKRARSKNEFASKIDAGLQELEETGYWIELLVDAGIVAENRLLGLLQEVDELTAILVTVSKSTKAQQFPLKKNNISKYHLRCDEKNLFVNFQFGHNISESSHSNFDKH